MRIRIRIRDTWLPSRNSLKRDQLWRIVRERQRRIRRTETGRSSSYVDRPKHLLVVTENPLRRPLEDGNL